MSRVEVLDDLKEGGSVLKSDILSYLLTNGRHYEVRPIFTYQRKMEIPDTPENRFIKPDLDQYNAEVRAYNQRMDMLGGSGIDHQVVNESHHGADEEQD
jgi:hypothetical protein